MLAGTLSSLQKSLNNLGKKNNEFTSRRFN
jgi:hypothetical protein